MRIFRIIDTRSDLHKHRNLVCKPLLCECVFYMKNFTLLIVECVLLFEVPVSMMIFFCLCYITGWFVMLLIALATALRSWRLTPSSTAQTGTTFETDQQPFRSMSNTWLIHLTLTTLKSSTKRKDVSGWHSVEVAWMGDMYLSLRQNWCTYTLWYVA